MRLRSALLAATVLAVPVAVHAQPVSGLYVGAGAGVNFINDPYIRHSPGLATVGKTQQFDPGFQGEASVGYGLGNGLRFELEGNYIDNNLHKTTGSAYPTRSGGTQENYGVFGNALFDFDVGLPWLFPYVGAGVGYEQTHWHNIKYYGNNAGVNTTVNGNGYDNNFAYQAIFGVAYPIPMAPGLSLTAEYRFVGLLDNAAFQGVKTTVPGGIAKGNLDNTSDFNHSVMFGIRYAFGVAPPPPPPIVPPAAGPVTPSRTYLVFFDWDKSTLTDRAKQIIAEAASASTKVAVTRIEVNGYTDLSGTAQYNQGLSVRRANAVAAELVRLGVAKKSIDIRGFGETHPLVPTAKGVREPQNRRVEIILK